MRSAQRSTSFRLLSFACTVATVPLLAAEPPAAPAIVGSAACKKCHPGFYEKWATSWHGLAMQPYGDAYARVHIAPATAASVAVRGIAYDVDAGPGKGFIRERGSAGETTYPIAHVMGGKNTTFFLTPFARGRFQVLPLAFDTRRKEWYDTTGSMVRHFRGGADEPVDWREPYLTFNTSCYGCHVSQLEKNYSLATDTYRTTWTEPGINCETCHGPAEEHLALMLAPDTGKDPADIKIISTRRFTPAQMNSLCSSCHAKAMALTGTFQPGGDFFDHYNLVCLEDRDFHPDGRDLGENFTCTTWLMSPCLADAGLTCMHCHTSSGRNKHAGADADKACLPCHEKHVAGATGHSHHPAESAGSRCVACHMPETEFARMRRHDHSMVPPAPAASARFASPNACNLCHVEKDAAWADRWVREWFTRDYQAPIIARAELIEAARDRDWKRLPAMAAYVATPGRNAVVAASLLRLLAAAADPRTGPAFAAAARDPSPLVRSSAARGLDPRDPSDAPAFETLVALGRDPVRAVRFEAASSLVRFPSASIPAAHRDAVAKAIAEYEALLRARTDDYASHYNLGNVHQERAELALALACYETSLKLNPTFVPAYVNASMSYARLGDNANAERNLRAALKQQPTSAEANLNLGLLLAEDGRRVEAEARLRAALEADPHLAQGAYNLGMLLADDQPAESIAYLRKAAGEAPGDPRYAYAYAYAMKGGGDAVAAATVLRALLAEHPTFIDAIALLGAVYEEIGERGEARSLYREASRREDLPATARQEFEARLEQLEER